MKKDRLVTLSYNEAKKIYSGAFFNELIGARVNKSLGSNEEKARLLKNEIQSIINDTNYNSYEGYKDAIRKQSSESVAIVYGNSKYEDLLTKELKQKYYEKILPFYSENKEKFLEDAFMLAGRSGSGKTKIIQNFLGNSEYNTPASTISNTTTGKTIVYNDGSAKELQLAFEEINEVSLLSKLEDNLFELIKYIVTTKSDNIQLSNLWKKILISNNLRCNLQYLICDKSIRNEINDIGLQLKKHLEPIIVEILKVEELNKNRRIVAKDIVNILTGNYDELNIGYGSEFLNKIKLIDVPKLIKKIYIYIKDAKVKVLKDMYRLIRGHLRSTENITIEINYLTNSKIKFNGSDFELKSNKILFNSGDEVIKFDNALNIANAMQLSIKYSNGKKIDDMLRAIFFEIMQKISLASETKSSLFPLISSLTVKGKFKSNLDLNAKKNYILIDSEGFGHNAGNFEISEEYSEFLKKTNKILWLIDFSSPITKNEQEALKFFADNGVLYKTAIVFTKADVILGSNDESVESRSYKMLENLYKEFEENNEIINSKLALSSRTVTLGDMDKKINKTKVMVNYRGIEFKVDLEESFATNFSNLIKIDNFEVANKKVFNYSLIKLANKFDIVIENLLAKYIQLINKSHWKTVEAWTERMGYDFDNRAFKYFLPEADLKYELKSQLNKIISNPINLSKEEIMAESDNLQKIQEILASKINLIVKKYICGESDKLGVEWRKLYLMNGPGSGNSRKYNAKILLEKSIGFNRDNNEENKILKDIIKYIKFECKDNLMQNINIQFKDLL